MSTPDYAQHPNNEDVENHFWDYFNGLLENRPNHIWAKSVTDVTCDNGIVTVTLDPASVVHDVEVFHDLLPGTFESWAGTAVAFWDEKSTWIRKTALSVHVVDVDGNKLGSASTEALAAVNHIDNIPGADQ